MLVYGDAPRREAPAAKLAALQRALRRLASLPPGLERHAALAAAFLEAGELAQGLADARFEVVGQDSPSAQDEAAMGLVMRLAAALRQSWDSGFRSLPSLELPVTLLGPLPESIAPKRAEGFAFYALYPEAYLAAAAASGLGPQTRVIGLRSIGLPLAALVATQLGAAPPLTLRPVGHPFQRELALSPDLASALDRPAPAHAIVDEGPGLSGSSFGAVADRLEAAGVARAGIHLFPSHAGAPGHAASPAHRARWPLLARHVVDFDSLALHSPRPAHRLERWVADLTGTATEPLRDLSGGAWRGLRYADGSTLPPTSPWQERRKFLLRGERGGWLLKFAGLGEAGQRKAAMARALAAGGFTPPFAGLRHGFLVEAWRDSALGLDQVALAPGALVERVAGYLGFRARHFPGGDGASVETLWEMACHNTAEGLGEDWARRLARRPPPPGLSRRIRNCAIDGRMQPWEWLVQPGEPLLKADALDHHATHDLVGCQDIAWDIVGATVELGLEAGPLVAALERQAPGGIDPGLIAFYRPCYLAFQLGAATMAAESNAHDPAEAARLRQAAAAYARALRATIGDEGEAGA